MNNSKSGFKSLLYKILFIISIISTVVGTAFSFDLYFNKFDVSLYHFNDCLSLTVYNVISVAVFIICLVVLMMPRFFEKKKDELSSCGILPMFAGIFAGFFCIAYPIMIFLDRNAEGMSINKIEMVVMLFAILSAAYCFVCALGVDVDKRIKASLGMCFVIFSILVIFTVYYSSSKVLITSPVRISSLLSFLSIMLFILSEVRYHLGIPSRAMYISFGIASMYFSFSSALPKLFVCLINDSVFVFSSETMLYGIEVFIALYAAFRLVRFMKKDAFAKEAEEVLESSGVESETVTTDDGSHVIEEEFLHIPDIPVRESKSFDEDAEETEETEEMAEEEEVAEKQETVYQELSEEKTETECKEELEAEPEKNFDEEFKEETKEERSDEFEMHFSECVKDQPNVFEEDKLYDFEKNENSNSSENDLPEDIGFVGGNEGDFELDDYDSADDIADEEFDDEISPFENTDIGSTIVEAMDDSPVELGEVIDYEQIRNSTSDDVMKPNVLDVMLADTIDFDADEDDEKDDDEEIEDDFFKVIDMMKKENQKNK